MELIGLLLDHPEQEMVFAASFPQPALLAMKVLRYCFLRKLPRIGVRINWHLGAKKRYQANYYHFVSIIKHGIIIP